jgi:hypothetical protein
MTPAWSNIQASVDTGVDHQTYPSWKVAQHFFIVDQFLKQLGLLDAASPPFHIDYVWFEGR